MTPGHPHQTDSAATEPARADDPEVTVIIPAYNQAATISDVIERISQLPVRAQIIVVDDGSTDATAQRAADFPEAEVVRHSRNRGKDAAVRTGLDRARGRTVVIQHPDLAHDPAELPGLIAARRDQPGVVDNMPPARTGLLRLLHRALGR